MTLINKMNTQSITLLYKTDVPGPNGRIYSKDVVKAAFEEYYSRIKNQQSFGNLGFRLYYSVLNNPVQDLNNASHRIDDIEDVPEGFNITATCLQKTKAGKILSEMLTNKVAVRFGLRGIGRIEDNHVKDFKLISVDILSADE